MKIIIHQKSEVFASIFQNIKNFSDHINIEFNQEGLYLQTMDTSHVSIVELKIPSLWFDNYECSETIVIGISSAIVGKILSLKDKSQILEVEVSQDKLLIHFLSHIDNPSTTVFEKHFEIPLIDIDSERMEIPNIESQAEFTLVSSHFADLINQLKIFGDTMDIQCSEEKIVLYSNSQENGKMSVDIKIDELKSFAIEEGKTVKLSYSLNYLHHICAFHRLSRVVELKLCNDYPLQVLYNLGQDAILALYLAPKMEE